MSENELEQEQIKSNLYTCCLGFNLSSNLHQIDINLVVRILGRYQSNPRLDHWKAVENVFRYLQGTENLCS